MIFKLSTTGGHYSNKAMMDIYKTLGFTFGKPVRGLCTDSEYLGIKGEPTIEIDTIVELVKLSELVGEIIISGDSLEIYDDHRE